MIKRYCYGKTFPTEAAVLDIAPESGAPGSFTFEDGAFSHALAADDIVYGLGENVRGINKRGWKYVSWCMDINRHIETAFSLYAAHNFLLVDGEKRFGAFFDCASRIEFDIGFTQSDRLRVTPEALALDVYIIEGGSLSDIVRQFRRLIGRSYIPPKWAFGFIQSRWGYRDEADIRSVYEQFAEHRLPLDAICLDIDYMQDFADFTVNTDRFPDLPGLCAQLRAAGVRLVPIIDAGVKILPGDETYETGRANGYFCKNSDGTDFVAAVWPGPVHFPDVLNPDARAWFGNRYKVLTDMGMEGFWNDMNEPAIFYTPDRLNKVCDAFSAANRNRANAYDFLSVLRQADALKNNPSDFSAMHHQVDGQLIRHDQVHNLFGYHMTRAAGEAMDVLRPGKRTLLFSRSSCIGMHRYGGIWFGDNHSWWSHLLLCLQMLPSVNMCGFLYAGADIGGFSGDATEDLVLRWTALGIFTPLMRNHCERYSRPQEPYRYACADVFRGLIEMRYRLLPYLYSEYVKAALSGDMLFRPLAFDYPDDAFARRVEDQLLLGEGLMIAPVYTQNARGRYVYLPEKMLRITMRASGELETDALKEGHHYIDVPLDTVVFFLRRGCVLPLAKPAGCTDALDEDTRTLLSFTEPGEGRYTLYRDDGYTTEYDQPAHFVELQI